MSRIGGKEVVGGKGQLTDAGTNVPLIANWSGVVDPGQEVEDLVDFSDFLPTLAEIGGGLPPGADRIDGVSFAGRLLKGTPSPRAWAFSEHEGRYWLRTRSWKLYDDGRLFDMLLDPTEATPILESSVPREAEVARVQLGKWREVLRR